MFNQNYPPNGKQIVCDIALREEFAIVKGCCDSIKNRVEKRVPFVKLLKAKQSKKDSINIIAKLSRSKLEVPCWQSQKKKTTQNRRAKINEFRKMVGSNGTLMTMRLVRSKLRKREESSTVSPVTAGNVEAPPHHHHHHHNHHHQHHHPHSHHQLHHNGTSHPQQQQNNSSSNHHHQQNGGSSPETGYSVPTPIAFRQSPSTVWVFPPLPPQPNIYNASSQVSRGNKIIQIAF